MAYETTKPAPNDDLDVSVTDIQQNFLISNTVMNVDHYPFNDLTSNKGFHKTVTSPDQVTEPSTIVEPKIFGITLTANVGLMQYTKGPNNGALTPLGNLQSPRTGISIPAAPGPGNSTPVLNFAGLALCYGTLYFLNKNFAGITYKAVDVIWNGTILVVSSTGGSLAASVAGSILSITNNSNAIQNDVYWSFEIQRIDV